MTFAQIVGTPTETPFDSTNTTSHPVALPDTDLGDLLIVEFSNDGAATVSTPADFSLISSDANGTNARLSWYAKDADGDEDGTTVDFVTSASERASAVVYRIQAGTWWGDLTTLADAIAVGTAATSSASANPDPPAVTAGWGIADNLFITGLANSGLNPTLGSAPTDYGDAVAIVGAAATASADLFSAHRELAAASDDPGTWTLTGTNNFNQTVANTIVIRPAAVATSGSIAATLRKALFEGTNIHPTGTVASILQAATFSGSGAQSQTGTMAATMQRMSFSASGFSPAESANARFTPLYITDARYDPEEVIGARFAPVVESEAQHG